MTSQNLCFEQKKENITFFNLKIFKFKAMKIAVHFIGVLMQCPQKSCTTELVQCRQFCGQFFT